MNAAHWHILGIGSIGGLFAMRLHEAGIPVTLLLRDRAAMGAYIAQRGLALASPDGRWTQAQPPAAIAAAPATAPSCLLVTTKAPDTLAALAPLLHDDGNNQLVLLLQNGMGVSEQVRARWPRVRLWNAVTTAGVWRESAFRLHQVADGETHAGRWDDGGDATLDTALDALFAAHIATRVDDIRAVLWRKLAINAVINALTAIHGCRNGALLEIAAARSQLAALAAEVESVATAAGIHFDEPVSAIAERVIRSTAANFSSMNRDVAAGRRTEIDFINGYVVAQAQRHGLAVPANEAVLAAVRAMRPA